MARKDKKEKEIMYTGQQIKNESIGELIGRWRKETYDKRRLPEEERACQKRKKKKRKKVEGKGRKE